jgi:hypothetical protein
MVVCLPGWGRRAPAKPAIEVTTDFCAVFSRNPGPPKRPKLSPSTCEPYREQVELGLSRGRNATAIWQDLVSEHGFAGGYEAVKRFVRKVRGPRRPEAAGSWLIVRTQTVQRFLRAYSAAPGTCRISLRIPLVLSSAYKFDSECDHQ